MDILKTRQSRTSLSIFALIILALLIPWQSHVHAPALLRPSLHTEVYSPAPARIAEIHVQNGDHVQAGQILIQLTSDHLDHEQAQSEKRIALLQARLDRRAANLRERRDGAVLDDEMQREHETLSGLKRLSTDLKIIATHDGVVSGLPLSLHTGRDVAVTERLLHLVNTEHHEVMALPHEDTAHRIAPNANFTFIADDWKLGKIHGITHRLAPTSLSDIGAKSLTSLHGGPLAVHENETGQLIAARPVFEVRGIPERQPQSGRVHRGIVKIKAKPQSPAKAIWQRIVHILLRETDF